MRRCWNWFHPWPWVDRTGPGPPDLPKHSSSFRTCLQWSSARDCCRNKRSEEHTSELQSLRHLVCRLLLEKKKKKKGRYHDLRGRRFNPNLLPLRGGVHASGGLARVCGAGQDYVFTAQMIRSDRTAGN